MTSDDATPLRRFRFGLRTLFLVVALVSAWLAYSMNWIRQRREAIATGTVLVYDDQLQDPGGRLLAPGGLWLSGEKGYAYADIELGDEEVAKLFPESKISYMLRPKVRTNAGL
jgi:hypothetical protein